MPVYTEKIQYSGFVVKTPYRIAGTIGSFLSGVLTVFSLILLIVAKNLFLLPCAIFFGWLTVYAAKSLKYYWTRYNLTFDEIKVLLFNKINKTIQWKDVYQIQEKIINFHMGMGECFQEQYLVFLAAEIDIEDAYIDYAKCSHVICIPKTDEIVSFIEQFKK